MHTLPRVSLPFLVIAVCFGAADADEVTRVAALIDRHIDIRLAEIRVAPAELADDAEFFRRVYLDIGGVIPPVSEVRQFLADQSPDKRRQAVERLLSGPRYIINFVNIWRKALLPEQDPDVQARFLNVGFEYWLRRKLFDDATYAEVVRELLAVPVEGVSMQSEGVVFLSQFPAALFLQARRGSPGDMAGAVARTMLGVRIECAQCHDHPFDDWKREQFWGFAAFFAELDDSNVTAGGNRVVQRRADLNRREIKIPDSNIMVQARHLDGSQPAWQERISPRVTLADWVTSRDNPFFARATVNRMWGHFFGLGLVDPVDDFSAENLPSHPALLDELAAEFVTHDWDLKFLIRAITSSRTYQRTSCKPDEGPVDPRSFARMAIKGLSPEQLCDSFEQAAGVFKPFNQAPNQVAIRGETTPRLELLRLFANHSDSPVERQTTILQALAMMNGQWVQQATGVDSGSTLAAVTDFPQVTTEERIETMFLATLGRPPRTEELNRLVRHIDESERRLSRQAAADVLWVLLNSAEFKLNH